MKNLPLFILFFVALLFVGCEKDIIGEAEDPTIIRTDPTELKLGNITGLVFDENNSPVENAVIEYSREIYTTDVNGYFRIKDTGASAAGGLVKINKDGYFKSFKFAFIETQQTSHLRIQLIEKNDAQSLNGTNGGIISVNGGGKITFPERSLVDENNVSYEGEATIYTHWYNPSDDNLNASMPGDLRGVSNDEKLVQLSTFGMMAVEIFSQSGQKLNLANGITAAIEFPLPQSLANNAPEEIPTWSLDEQTGVWIEESTASLNNGNYIAEVSHFSFWNCDIPANLIKLKGKVVNVDGRPLPWYQILITVKNSGVCRGGYTNSNGVFCGYVPKNTTLIIQVKDECGGVIYEEEIGPYGVDTDLGELEVGNSTEGQTLISGSLRCDGQPIPNGYAKITLTNGLIYIAETDEAGRYSIVIEGCGLTQVTVQGIDIENNRTSGIVTLNLNSNDNEVEIIPFEVCQELDEFIRWKISGGDEELFIDPSAKIIDGNLEIVAQLPINIVHTSIIITAPNVVLGDNNIDEIISTIVNGGNTQWAGCGKDQLVNCENVTINLITLGGLGEFIEGTFMGEIANADGLPETIMGSFRIMVDFVAESNAVSGVVWADDNEDGIRQNGEAPLANVQITMRGGSQDTLLTTLTNNEGEYSFDRIFQVVVSLEVGLEPGFQVSIANQGTDDAIDSDFESNPQPITFTPGDKLENYDAGIHTDGELICEVEVVEFPTCPGNNPFAIVGVTIDRGTAPYTITFNGDVVENTNLTSLEIGDVQIGGLYNYTITDASGNSCNGEFDLEFIDAFACEARGTNSSGGLNNGSATVIAFTDEIETAEWSNGATGTSIFELSPGTYSVTVTSPNGCTSECDTVIEEDDLSCEIIGPDVACEAGFQYDLIVETNQSDVTYLWSTSSTDQFIVPTINATSTYSVTVTAANGTSTTCEKTIELSSGIVCTIDDITIGCSQNDQITVNATGGTPPYNYSWITGDGAPSITVFQEGTYSVTVTDANGCLSTCTGIVESDEGISCVISTTVGNCGTDESSASVEVSNGSGDFSYQWSNGADTQEILNLVTGNYTVTVTDNDTGCTTICETQVAGSIPVGIQIVFEQNCDDPEYFTSMVALATGGSGIYTYSWSNGSSEIETNIETLGLFSVTVTDSQGCTAVAELDVVPSASRIGDFVWIDDEMGEAEVYDPNIDLGVANVSLLLYSSDINGLLTVVDSTFTDVEGFYEFDNIPLGDYVVSIDVPANMILVQPNSSQDIDLDSNFDQGTALSEVITVNGCESNYSIDAGLKKN